MQCLRRNERLGHATHGVSPACVKRPTAPGCLPRHFSHVKRVLKLWRQSETTCKPAHPSEKTGCANTSKRRRENASGGRSGDGRKTPPTSCAKRLAEQAGNSLTDSDHIAWNPRRPTCFQQRGPSAIQLRPILLEVPPTRLAGMRIRDNDSRKSPYGSLHATGASPVDNLPVARSGHSEFHGSGAEHGISIDHSPPEKPIPAGHRTAGSIDHHDCLAGLAGALGGTVDGRLAAGPDAR